MQNRDNTMRRRGIQMAINTTFVLTHRIVANSHRFFRVFALWEEINDTTIC